LKPCEWEKRLFEFSQISWYDGQRVVNYSAKHVLRKEVTAKMPEEAAINNAKVTRREFLLNVEEPWSGREEIAFYGTLDDYVSLNIAAGHPDQRMPSWSQAYGGPLRRDQIADLTAFVLNWQGPQPPGVRIEGVAALPTQPPEEATPEAPAGPVGEGDPANGELVFTQYCHPATVPMLRAERWDRRCCVRRPRPSQTTGTVRSSTMAGPVRLCPPGVVSLASKRSRTLLLG
jgi:hypothetical protein